MTSQCREQRPPLKGKTSHQEGSGVVEEDGAYPSSALVNTINLRTKIISSYIRVVLVKPTPGCQAPGRRCNASSHLSLTGKGIVLFPFHTHEETEAKRGRMTCPKALTWPGVKPKLPEFTDPL